MRRVCAAVMVAGVLFAHAASAGAQQRPLVTEDPETIGSGLVLIEGGFDEQHDVFYPASGLEGNLLRLPTLGVSFGLSSIAELQIDGGLYNRLNVTSRAPAPLSPLLDFDGDTTHDVEDIVIATKVRLLSETAGRPAFALRFATRLPNASNESGLGLDTTDFFVSTLFGKTVQSIRFVGNAGLGILADPTRRDAPERCVHLRRVGRPGGQAGARNRRRGQRPASTPAVASRRSAPSTRGAFRFGGRFTAHTVRVDAGVIIGLTSADPSVGFTAGVTWVFKGFHDP